MGGKKEIYRDVRFFYGALQLCMLLVNHFTFLCFNCFCLCMYLFSLWATIYNKLIGSVTALQ